VLGSYRAATKRLLLLDYDGTLVSFAERPERAAPPPVILGLLRQLAATSRNRVALVSGRRREDLESWFGTIDRLWLVAEHGAILRAPGDSEWKPLRPYAASDWKPQIQPILDHFVARTPGSFIEEKEHSLGWHYRMADPEFGEWLANELTTILDGMLADTELRAVRGHKIVEVKPIWINKGEVCGVLTADWQDFDFCLAVGDDHTDEDLFERLAPPACTVRVGDAPTRARFFVRDEVAVRTFLQSFVSSDEFQVAAAANTAGR
jgi:trehalose 6-phosphate synthase/phosphatase